MNRVLVRAEGAGRSLLAGIAAKAIGAKIGLAVLASVLAGPALAQDTQDTRIRRMEAEIRALQRKVFPGGDGRLFAPEITPAPTARPTVGTPATSPVNDLLARMEALETQLSRLTAQTEQNANRISLIEARLGPAAAEPSISPAPDPAAPDGAPSAAPANGAAVSNLSAMTGGASAPRPATATPVRAIAAPPERLTAVRAIEKPATGDAGDDDYSYGFRLWEAKFYPEAQQQLKMTVEKYPRHSRISYARNLLGRAFLDDGKPRDAAAWFLQNYQADKTGARAGDSLLFLAESMKRINDTNRACVALAEFAQIYAIDAAGRLKSQYDATRSGVRCNR